MLHRVAKTLGIPIYILKATMPARELTSWALYFRHEPTNSVEIQLALLTHTVSAYLGAKGKRVEDYIITAFRPQEKKEDVVMTSKMLLNAWGLGDS